MKAHMFLFTAVVICLQIVSVGRAETLAEFEKGRPLQDALESRGVEGIMASVAPIIGLDLKESVEEARVEENPLNGMSKFVITLVSGTRVYLPDDARYLAGYRAARSQNRGAEPAQDTDVGVDVARESAQRLIDALALDVDLEQASVHFQPDARGDSTWAFGILRTYRSIPTESGVRIVISSRTGNIVEFFDAGPCPAPESFEQRIKNEEAVQQAVDFLCERYPMMPFALRQEPRLTIARPTNFWTKEPGERTVKEEFSRLCWHVSLHGDNDSASPSVALLVDAETGAVVGGCR